MKVLGRAASLDHYLSTVTSQGGGGVSGLSGISFVRALTPFRRALPL